MLICLFDSQGIVPKEFVPQGHKVNQQFYRAELERLRNRVMRVRPNIKNWVLHHDNAPCHRLQLMSFWQVKTSLGFLNPPYSPDLSPCNFFLFPRVKMHLKRRHFGQ
ncbi:hypothetical protein AVEN_96517-1 [Araneus ventricosus]|uniref:Mariner Mos1 transposase n=1 Tax=Araneus ventricosus TaxID=182803 RepID=A0A4Y2CX82_ARAVE|nr:hypothetical protein AVEN_96517-1 [Araneus ventricosus]